MAFYHLRLLHKQEFGNGLYLFVILALIPKILSQGAYFVDSRAVCEQVKAILVAQHNMEEISILEDEAFRQRMAEA